MATPGSAGLLTPTSSSNTSPDKAKAHRWRNPASGPEKPAKISSRLTNGHFPSDYDIARAIQQMWKKVGIDAELETIEYAKYFELNRGAKLPEATLYSWDNATGDPEIFAGYLLNPKMPFSAWKGMEVGEKVARAVRRRPTTRSASKATRALNKAAVEAGATIPLLQSVHTVVRKKNLQLREIRQRLDARQHDAMVMIASWPHRAWPWVVKRVAATGGRP